MRDKKFISYKSEERHIATCLRDTLQGWGYQMWFDRDDIPKGGYFRYAIQSGLEVSDAVIGIVTSKALASREVLTEWDYAFSGEPRLLLLLYEAVQLPYWLKGVQYIDCTDDEASAMEQLKEALESPDTSNIIKHEVPPEIKRHRKSDAAPQYNRLKMATITTYPHDNGLPCSCSLSSS